MWPEGLFDRHYNSNNNHMMTQIIWHLIDLSFQNVVNWFETIYIGQMSVRCYGSRCGN